VEYDTPRSVLPLLEICVYDMSILA